MEVWGCGVFFTTLYREDGVFSGTYNFDRWFIRNIWNQAKKTVLQTDKLKYLGIPLLQ